MPVDDFDEVTLFVDAFQDRNGYVGVATRAATGGTLKDCVTLHSLFADLDFKDSPEPGSRARVQSFPLAPSAVVASGGGLQAYWFLTEPFDLQNRDEPHGKQLLRRLAAALGADSTAAEVRGFCDYRRPQVVEIHLRPHLGQGTNARDYPSG